MAITLERNNSGADRSVERSGFVNRRKTCGAPIYNSPEFSAADRKAAPVAAAEDRSGSLSSSSTSSIGKNSDDSSGGGGGGEGEEVQSEYKEGPLDSLDALEEVLPVKKGISKFYCGKSKSFTSLSDAASCSTIKEITKPEDAYTRKRKNLLAYSYLFDKNSSRRSSGGMSKRPTNSRSMLALAAIINNSESNSSESSISNSSPPGNCLPPLPPHARRTIQSEVSSSLRAHKFSPWRSFSLFDLQGAEAEAASPSIPGLWVNNGD